MDDEQQLTTPGHDQDEQQRLQQYGIIVEHEPYVLWIFDYVYIYLCTYFTNFTVFNIFSTNFTIIHMNLSLKYS